MHLRDICEILRHWPIYFQVHFIISNLSFSLSKASVYAAGQYRQVLINKTTSQINLKQYDNASMFPKYTTVCRSECLSDSASLHTILHFIYASKPRIRNLHAVLCILPHDYSTHITENGIPLTPVNCQTFIQSQFAFHSQNDRYLCLKRGIFALSVQFKHGPAICHGNSNLRLVYHQIFTAFTAFYIFGWKA